MDQTGKEELWSEEDEARRQMTYTALETLDSQLQTNQVKESIESIASWIKNQAKDNVSEENNLNSLSKAIDFMSIEADEGLKSAMSSLENKQTIVSMKFGRFNKLLYETRVEESCIKNQLFSDHQKVQLNQGKKVHEDLKELDSRVEKLKSSLTEIDKRIRSIDNEPRINSRNHTIQALEMKLAQKTRSMVGSIEQLQSAFREAGAEAQSLNQVKIALEAIVSVWEKSKALRKQKMPENELSKKLAQMQKAALRSGTDEANSKDDLLEPQIEEAVKYESSDSESTVSSLEFDSGEEEEEQEKLAELKQKRDVVLIQQRDTFEKLETLEHELAAMVVPSKREQDLQNVIVKVQEEIQAASIPHHESAKDKELIAELLAQSTKKRLNAQNKLAGVLSNRDALLSKLRESELQILQLRKGPEGPVGEQGDSGVGISLESLLPVKKYYEKQSHLMQTIKHINKDASMRPARNAEPSDQQATLKGMFAYIVSTTTKEQVSNILSAATCKQDPVATTDFENTDFETITQIDEEGDMEISKTSNETSKVDILTSMQESEIKKQEIQEVKMEQQEYSDDSDSEIENSNDIQLLEDIKQAAITSLQQTYSRKANRTKAQVSRSESVFRILTRPETTDIEEELNLLVQDLSKLRSIEQTLASKVAGTDFIELERSRLLSSVEIFDISRSKLHADIQELQYELGDNTNAVDFEKQFELMINNADELQAQLMSLEQTSNDLNNEVKQREFHSERAAVMLQNHKKESDKLDKQIETLKVQTEQDNKLTVKQRGRKVKRMLKAMDRTNKKLFRRFRDLKSEERRIMIQNKLKDIQQAKGQKNAPVKKRRVYVDTEESRLRKAQLRLKIRELLQVLSRCRTKWQSTRHASRPNRNPIAEEANDSTTHSSGGGLSSEVEAVYIAPRSITVRNSIAPGDVSNEWRNNSNVLDAQVVSNGSKKPNKKMVIRAPMEKPTAKQLLSPRVKRHSELQVEHPLSKEFNQQDTTFNLPHPKYNPIPKQPNEQNTTFELRHPTSMNQSPAETTYETPSMVETDDEEWMRLL